MEDTDFSLRLTLISAERLRRLTSTRANREAILAELDYLQQRAGETIVIMENSPDWVPSKDILPE